MIACLEIAVCVMCPSRSRSFFATKKIGFYNFDSEYHNLTSIRLSEGYFQGFATSIVLLTTFHNLSKIILLGRDTGFQV